MNSEEAKKLEAHNQIAIDFQNKVINNCIWNCCLNCTNYDSRQELCRLYNQRPPVTIVVTGCDKHFPKRLGV